MPRGIPIPGGARAEPLQLSFIGPTLQLVDDDADVRGVRLSLLYGVNENVTGLDVGLVSHARDHVKGVQLGSVLPLVNWKFD
jgi:hypothetical protein